MKKFLAIILTFAMLMSMSVTAFAADSKDVTASYTPTYAITIAETTNGTVTADVTRAAEDATVALTVTPAEGFELEDLTVTDASSNLVSVTNNQFTMPASDVTVSATFKKASGDDTAATLPNPLYVETSWSEPLIRFQDENKAGVGSPKSLTAVSDGIWMFTGTVPEGAVHFTVYSVTDSDYPTTVATLISSAGSNNLFKTEDESWSVYTPAGEDTTATITGYSDGNGNSVTANVSEAKEGDTVTLTVTTTGKYQLKSIAAKDADGNPLTWASIGITKYTFVMPASNVTVEATFEEVLTTSADITWGSLSFTYDDTIPEGETEETGWTCEEGANVITVKNTGDTTINAQPIYEAKEGYTEISGKFYESMTAETNLTMGADLAPDASYDFYLKLSGKPSKALSGATIGTVTISIVEGSGE